MAPENETPFHIGSDGEIVIPSTGMEAPSEVPEIDSVTAILTTPKNKQPTGEEKGQEFVNKSPSPDVSIKTVSSAKGEEKPGEVSTVSEVETELRNENSALNNRIAALEARLNAETVEAEKFKAEEDASNFRGEIATAVSEIFGDLFDDDKKNKLIDVIEKVATKKSEANKDVLDNFVKANDQAATEIRQVLAHYDGTNGKPTIIQMKPLTDWIANKFGSDVLSNFPGVTIFRAAENIPFMLWLEEKYPQQTQKMNFQQFCVASEEVRKAFYKGKNPNSYSHLESFLNGNKAPDNEKVEDLKRTAANLTPTPGVGLAAENSSIVRKEKAPATSAREAVERSLAELGI